jgi:alkanesulfonate monooxygenase SsuD/methylene tetrahydromethanopterin reductase-like flavin-dependent oxidoreductase (luciferase family)
VAHPISLALHLDGDGAHPAAWRQALHPPAALLTGRRVADVVALAETAGFASVTFAGGHLPPGSGPDITARIDALQQAAFAGPLTTRVGLVPEVEATFVEPFHTANQLSSLDHVSRGRGGWIVKASGGADEARVYGREPFTDSAALRREASDVIEVSRRLWDSWEADAVIRDTATWRYIDRDKLHYVEFTGERFSVKGPSYVPGPPQGQLPIFADDGLVDPHEVDVTIVHAPNLAGLIAAARNARVQGAARVAADLEIALDSRGVSAAERLRVLDASTAWRETGNTRIAGTPDELLAAIRALAGEVDIVRLIPAVIDIDLPELRFVVLPELLRDGISAAPHPGATLRETLGLEPARNRYATR